MFRGAGEEIHYFEFPVKFDKRIQKNIIKSKKKLKNTKF